MAARSLAALAFAGFVALGLPEGATGVAWPSIATGFGRPIAELGLLLAALVAGYVVASALSGPFIRRVGVGPVLAASSAVSAIALFGLALSGAWPLLLAAMGVLGVGTGLVDAGLNAHASLAEGARFMHLLHASFGVGATIGPAVMTLFVVAGDAWRFGYAVFGVVHVGLGVAYLVTRDRWVSAAVDDASPRPSGLTGVVAASLLAFMLYTGTEVAAGQWAFAVLSEDRGLSEAAAGLWVTGFWASLTVGRFLAGWAGDRLRPDGLLIGGLVAAVVGTVLFWWAPTRWSGAGGLVLVGFGLAPVFPALVLLTPLRVGAERAATVIGLQLAAAAIGAAAVPGAIGVAVARLDLGAVAPALVGVALATLAASEVARVAGERSRVRRA